MYTKRGLLTAVLLFIQCGILLVFLNTPQRHKTYSVRYNLHDEMIQYAFIYIYHIFRQISRIKVFWLLVTKVLAAIPTFP